VRICGISSCGQSTGGDPSGWELGGRITTPHHRIPNLLRNVTTASEQVVWSGLTWPRIGKFWLAVVYAVINLRVLAPRSYLLLGGCAV
jgi:hypothetical protein